MYIKLSIRLTFCFLIFSALGCRQGYNTSRKSSESLSSKSPAVIGSTGQSTRDYSGNGEGYGGIAGTYYAFGPNLCNGSSGVFLKSVLDKSDVATTLVNNLCSQNPIAQIVSDSSIFSADYNSKFLLYENGDVFEKHDSLAEANDAQRIKLFCRGKRVYYDDDNWTSVHYLQGLNGFRQAPLRDELWVDYIVRVQKNPTYSGTTLEGVYDGEVVYEDMDASGNIVIKRDNGYTVDHWIRSSSNDYLSERGVLQIDINTNTDDTFFEGRLIHDIGYDSLMVDMVCTQGVK